MMVPSRLEGEERLPDPGRAVDGADEVYYQEE
jgi:hypothetical protein